MTTADPATAARALRQLGVRLPRRPLTAWLVTGVVLSVVTLVFIGDRAVDEWQRSATLLTARRAEAAVDLFVQALARDMRGAQTSVLLSSTRLSDTHGPYDLVASAFARYPYPEVFFSATTPIAAETTTFFTRVDRAAPWLPPPLGTERQSVATSQAPEISRRIQARLAQDALRGARYSVFDLKIDGVIYQAVTTLSYDNVYRERVTEVFGFLVNLSWVRDHYFGDLAVQVARIAGGNGIALTVADERGGTVVKFAADTSVDARDQRHFPLLFFDPLLVAAQQPPDLTKHVWTAGAVISGDPTLQAANQGARQTLLVATSTGLLLAIAIVLSIRAARESAALAELRSDFVATVTHELKTPIATIRAISETIASGRVTKSDMQQEYAQMAVYETKRLTRLIDNLLAYARVTDVTEVYWFQRLSPNELLDTALREFSTQLAEGQFEFYIDVEPDLPMVRADQTAIGLTLTNLVDNAIRYSGASRFLRLAAHCTGASVVFEIEDKGTGIAAEDVPHITRRFFRGRGVATGGSGLGLAIAQRIVADHGGVLKVTSALGTGTIVSVTLPIDISV